MPWPPPHLLDFHRPHPVSDLDPVPARRHKTHRLWWQLRMLPTRHARVLRPLSARVVTLIRTAAPLATVTGLGHRDTGGHRASTWQSREPRLTCFATTPRGLWLFHCRPAGLVFLWFLTSRLAAKSISCVPWQGSADILLLNYKIKSVGKSFTGCQDEVTSMQILALHRFWISKRMCRNG